MLIIKRKKGESITIGGKIVVTVLRDRNAVHLSIVAPREIEVVRTELLEKKKEEFEAQ